MKFARYLEETQTPEWKKAYIDYRGLKKRITAIKRAYDAAAGTSQDDGSDPFLPLQRSSTSNDSERSARPISPRSVHSSRAASGSNGPLPFSESSLARQARSARKEPAEISVIAATAYWSPFCDSGADWAAPDASPEYHCHRDPWQSVLYKSPSSATKLPERLRWS
ncbi:hypothetical protein PYCCODRAFT_1030570 [Trametes coccinea BRFM310]|uniref:SPX domain-containing protein n=1 Tax=Trametes coccinea (strain BRFM310) TaxID=1353009 RepID=A0A1Y2IAE4_TRAC3|nr:hypothetical protein PYCCODRAFT_1030570 [Trametes coccinea BRFM310]